MFKDNKQSGAVSLFVVIFAMLLITVVTISFLRLMLKDQEQAITNDLSQSAYDSAQAGTEDAKRALILYRTLCSSGNSAACVSEKAVINNETCNQGLQNVIDVPPTGEVLVQQQQSSNDAKLNQAYTCVKMQLETDDYIGILQSDTSKLIPLKSTGPFTEIIVQWYTNEDLGTSSTVVNLASPVPQQLSQGGQPLWPLIGQSSWPANRPPVFRTQLMQFGANFTLSSFDSTVNGTSNANTLFLYPVGQTGTVDTTQDTIAIADRDIRRVATGSPESVRCSGNLEGGGYACSVRIVLPNPIGTSSPDTRNAYLRVTSLYKSTRFRVMLSGTQFDGVQPIIDATGRANDIFRRVESRVDLIDTNFPFPDSAVDISGNFCKDFSVTTDASAYTNSCTP